MNIRSFEGMGNRVCLSAIHYTVFYIRRVNEKQHRSGSDFDGTCVFRHKNQKENLREENAKSNNSLKTIAEKIPVDNPEMAPLSPTSFFLLSFPTATTTLA